MQRVRRRLPRVAVASDQSLVAESVRAALAGRGVDALILGWPGQRRPSEPQSQRLTFAAGLMISELDTAERVRSSRILMAESPGRWLAMTSAPVGAAWGAVLEAGAARVVPTSWTLDEVAVGLLSLLEGRPSPDESDRAGLVEEWHHQRSLRVERAERLQSLTPRERQVLEMLFDGVSVGSIASLLGVSTATVRTQVKAVLRKLDVSSQLAAVSTFEQHTSDSVG